MRSMQGRLEIFAADKFGTALANRAVRVLNIDGTPAKLYADPISGIELPSNVVMTNARAGQVVYCSGIFRVVDVLSGQVLQDNVEVFAQNVLDPALPVFGGARSGSNATASLQAALNAAAAGEGFVWTADVPYVIDNLTVPAGAVWDRAGRGRHRLTQSSSVVGAMITLLPGLGVPKVYVPGQPSAGGAARSVLRHLALDGGSAGVINDAGHLATGSRLILGLSNLDEVREGYVVEADGVQGLATVTAIEGTTVQISSPATLTSVGAAPVRFRPGVLRNANAVAGQYVLQMANTDQIVPGMRAAALNLAGGIDGEPAVVRAVSANSVTTDRLVAVGGPFTVLFFQRNPVVLVPEASWADAYDDALLYPGPILEGLALSGGGGDLLRIRPGRDGTLVRLCSLEDGEGGGVMAAGCADLRLEGVSLGNVWDDAISLVGCASPSLAAIGLGRVRRPVDCVQLRAIDSPQLSVDGCALRGRIELVNTDDQVATATLCDVRAEFSDQALGPDGHAPAVVTANGVNVTWIGGSFSPDAAAGRSRADYLARTDNGGAVDISGVALHTNPANPECPFAYGVSPVGSSVSIVFRDLSSGKLIMSGIEGLGGPRLAFSPENYFPTADGVTPDDAAVDQAIEAARQFALSVGVMGNAGRPIPIDLGGRVYGVKNGHPVGARGLVLQNGGLNYLPGGNLSPVVPMLSSAGGANGTIFRGLTLNCGKVCAGISLGGPNSKAMGNTIFNIKGYGIALKSGEGADRFVGGNRIWEYGTGDPEFKVRANFTAYGIMVDDNDAIIGEDNVVRWCFRNLYGTPNAKTTVVRGSHFYNGASGVVDGNGVPIKFVRPKNIVWEGSGLTLVGNYLDNGETDLMKPATLISGNMALYDADRCTLEYCICLYANGQSGPYQFNSPPDWLAVSDEYLNGTVPLIALRPNGGNNWAGNYRHFESLAGRKWACHTLVHTKLQADLSPNVIFCSPGDASKGAVIALVDDDTDVSDDEDLPRAQSAGNKMRLYKRHLVSEKGVNSVVISKGDSEKVRQINNGANNRSVTYPANAEPGFVHTLVQLGTGTVSLLAEGTATLRVRGVAPPYKMLGQDARVNVLCLENDSGTNAVFLLSGDVGAA